MNANVVKSAGRVFEVLELFDAERRALTATGIARALKYPASSSVALLKSMVTLGYLSYDPNERTYFPTIQLATVSRWLEDSFFVEGHLLELMDDLAAASGESIMVCWQNELHMQFIRAKMSAKKTDLPPLDSRLPLFTSVVGLTALTLKRDVEIAQLAERSREFAEEAKFDLSVAMDHIRTFRAQGYGCGYDFCIPGLISCIAWVLRHRRSSRAVVVSVFGPTERIKSATRSIVQTGKAAIKSYAGV